MILEKAEAWNIEQVRRDFPILDTHVGPHYLVYLDNAATTQKPRQVIDCLEHYYRSQNANIHRGVHYLSQQATDAYEQARREIAAFLNAREAREVIFVRGATEAINLVASSWGGQSVGPGDEILLTTMEHHANIVPWQLLAEKTGARIVVAPVTAKGELIPEEWEKLIGPRTRLAAFCHVSNSLGTINPAEWMISKAHEKGVPVLLDGAQSVVHLPIDVQQLDCDFFAFSGHKLFGPTGIGVLYGKADLLNAMSPYQGGGDMIERVSFEGTTFRQIPERFEAGTPNISGAIGLAEAVRYVKKLGMAAIEARERALLDYATEKVREIPGVRIVGEAENKVGVLSFVMEGAHPHDIGTILDSEGIAIRAGHHCTQPLWQALNLTGTARASFAFYNTMEEVDKLVAGLHKTRRLFA